MKIYYLKSNINLDYIYLILINLNRNKYIKNFFKKS